MKECKCLKRSQLDDNRKEGVVLLEFSIEEFNILTVAVGGG